MKPKTIEEALAVMERAPLTEREQWQALAVVLREMALSQGVDTEREIDVKFDAENDPPMGLIVVAFFVVCAIGGLAGAALAKFCGFF